MALGLSIPLRHHHHRSVRTFPIPGLGREETRARHIVFDRGRVHRAGPGQLIAIEIEVVDRRQPVKLIARAERVFSVTAKDLPRLVTVDMINDIGQSPLKGAAPRGCCRGRNKRARAGACILSRKPNLPLT